jgi:histidyl-tRNA synthetase
VIKVNSRKLLDGVLEQAGVPIEDKERRGAVLRAIDKFDRVGARGLGDLLGAGRKDESGDFTRGAGLDKSQIEIVLAYILPGVLEGTVFGRRSVDAINAVNESTFGSQGLKEIDAILDLVKAGGYTQGQIFADTSIIRGLDYYTGCVFEAQLTFPVQNEKGQDVVFGSVGGGGRYDDLVARFTGQKTPAVGFSIGVSRLLTALQMRKAAVAESAPLVVVTVFDKNNAAPAFAMVRELRAEKIRAEAYVGTGKLGDQFKYADKRGAALVVIEGPDEIEAGKVTIKDLALGAELSKSAETRADWVGSREAEVVVNRSDLIAEVRKLLARGR